MSCQPGGLIEDIQVKYMLCMAFDLFSQPCCYCDVLSPVGLIEDTQVK